MISSDCNFKTFIEAVKDKDREEVIYLAEQEATQADRLVLQSKYSPKEKQKCGKQYSAILKAFIQYIKYTVKPAIPEDHEYKLFPSRDKDAKGPSLTGMKLC
jgi:hypothetical protein